MRARLRVAAALTAVTLVTLAGACGSDSADGPPGRDVDGSAPPGALDPAGPDSSDLEDASTDAGDAAAALEAFFDALEREDFAATGSSVDEEQLAVLTAVEGATGAEVATMLRGGVPETVRADFWRGFTDGLPELSEMTVGRIRVGAAQDLGESFAGVEIGTADPGGAAGSSSWILRANDEERWRVDLFATFGPVFSPNLAAWYETLEAGPDRDLIAEAITRAAASLRLGVDREPLGPLSGAAVDGVDTLLSLVES